MTNKEMIYLFEEFLGTLDATISKPKTSDTVEWLNLAQEELYTEAYREMDRDENAKKVLLPFIGIDYQIISFTDYNDGTFQNAVRVEIPATYRYITREELKVNVDAYGRIDATETEQSIQEVKPIGIDYYNSNKNNPDRKPNYKVSWRLDLKYLGAIGLVGNQHLLIMGEGIIPDTYYISYVADITLITDTTATTCAFPSWYHDAIVKRAVSNFARARTTSKEPVQEEKTQ